ncbi:SDR family oxidoreductase [Candidatus Micrarchaeota archaeon]|jgi:UDP-glucose 4-epimerase|nr:SDR family oxidoreductase [Candidatus Micrarchaeota archaeon]
MTRKYAITGGAGFIGSNLVEALAEENEVVVVDDLSAGRKENLAGQNVEFVEGSILDLDLLKEAFEGCDCVFHLAAIASVQRSVEDPIFTSRVGVEGTLNVLVAARDAGAEKVVFASSAAVYGDSPALPKREDMRPEPKSPYAAAKLAGEGFCLAFNEVYGMKNVALRYFNVYGPRQDPNSEYAAVIPKFVSAYLAGDAPVIFGDGEQTRDFVYVKDVVRANILASKGCVPGVYNIASGTRTSLNELSGLVKKITRSELEPIYSEARAGDIRDSVADVKRAMKIGYSPKFTLEEGLRGMIEYSSTKIKPVVV